VVKKQPSDLGFFFPSVGCPLLGVGVCQGKWGPWLPRPPFQLQQQETQGKAESPTDDKETGGFHQDKSKATADIESVKNVMQHLRRCPGTSFFFSVGALLGGFGSKDSISRCLYFLR